MKGRDNYLIQLRQAQARFLTYDQGTLAGKLNIPMDEDYLYPRLLGNSYRLNRHNGTQERLGPQGWEDGNSFGEVMTLLDLVCDSRPDRCAAGTWKKLHDFGWHFYRSESEDRADPQAELFAREPDRFAAACRDLGGRPIAPGDVGFAIPVFESLEMGLQLWLGDEEFPSRLVVLWDANALQYLRYETMHFATGLILRWLKDRMQK